VTPDLNPARLARFTDWVTTLPPRPLPRTAIPVSGEYHLDYVARLAEANHLKFGELTAALDDTASITLHSLRGWKQREQERLAAAAGQPLGRIGGCIGPTPAFTWATPRSSGRHCARPATGAPPATASPGVGCHLLPHQTVCRRHRLWTGPAARSHVSQFELIDARTLAEDTGSWPAWWLSRLAGSSRHGPGASAASAGPPGAGAADTAVRFRTLGTSNRALSTTAITLATASRISRVPAAEASGPAIARPTG
jgi:hypothetical protein